MRKDIITNRLSDIQQGCEEAMKCFEEELRHCRGYDEHLELFLIWKILYRINGKVQNKILELTKED